MTLRNIIKRYLELNIKLHAKSPKQHLIAHSAFTAILTVICFPLAIVQVIASIIYCLYPHEINIFFGLYPKPAVETRLTPGALEIIRTARQLTGKS
ncbi:MAG: hypothetical protein GY914_00940 [Prochlorococcus sp.]|nr:hypothetical protein [Prochlorococcus sp.]